MGMKKDHRDTLDNQFNGLMDRVFGTIKFPLSSEDLQDEFFLSIPHEFVNAVSLLVGTYGDRTSHWTNQNYELLVLDHDQTSEVEVFSIAHRTPSGQYEETPRPHGAVMLRENSPHRAALLAFCKEFNFVRGRANEAKKYFSHMTQYAHTSAEVFYAIPLLRQFADRERAFSWDLPKGRRPANYNPETFPPAEVDAINQMLLLALIVKDVHFDHMTWSARISVNRFRKTAPEGAVV